MVRIVAGAAARCGITIENGVKELIADYAANGRDAVKILQSALNIARMDGRCFIGLDDARWVIKAGRYAKRSEPFLKENEKIIDISMFKKRG